MRQPSSLLWKIIFLILSLSIDCKVAWIFGDCCVKNQNKGIFTWHFFSRLNVAVICSYNMSVKQVSFSIIHEYLWLLIKWSQWNWQKNGQLLLHIWLEYCARNYFHSTLYNFDTFQTMDENCGQETSRDYFFQVEWRACQISLIFLFYRHFLVFVPFCIISRKKIEKKWNKTFWQMNLLLSSFYLIPCQDYLPYI